MPTAVSVKTMVLLHNVELACDPHLLELVDLPPEAHPRPLHAELLYSNFYNIVSSIDLSISHRPGFQNFVARNKAHSGSEVHRLRPILLTSRQCNVFSQMGVSEESSRHLFTGASLVCSVHERFAEALRLRRVHRISRFF